MESLRITAIVLAFAMSVFYNAASVLAAGGEKEPFPATVKPDTVYSMLEKGAGIWLLDVRGPAEFSGYHAVGSVNISAEEAALRRLPKESIYIVVDDSLGQRAATRSREVLMDKGYLRVAVLEGGLYGWASSGLPLAGDARVGRTTRPVAVQSEELKAAMRDDVKLEVFDLRDEKAITAGTYQGFEKVGGKTLEKRIENIEAILKTSGNKGLAAKLAGPRRIVLVFDRALDAEALSMKIARLGVGDVRYLAGGYEGMVAVRGTVGFEDTFGGCGTCP